MRAAPAEHGYGLSGGGSPWAPQVGRDAGSGPVQLRARHPLLPAHHRHRVRGFGGAPCHLLQHRGFRGNLEPAGGRSHRIERQPDLPERHIPQDGQVHQQRFEGPGHQHRLGAGDQLRAVVEEEVDVIQAAVFIHLHGQGFLPGARVQGDHPDRGLAKKEIVVELPVDQGHVENPLAEAVQGPAMAQDLAEGEALVPVAAAGFGLDLPGQAEEGGAWGHAQAQRHHVHEHAGGMAEGVVAAVQDRGANDDVLAPRGAVQVAETGRQQDMEGRDAGFLRPAQHGVVEHAVDAERTAFRAQRVAGALPLAGREGQRLGQVLELLEPEGLIGLEPRREGVGPVLQDEILVGVPFPALRQAAMHQQMVVSFCHRGGDQGMPQAIVDQMVEGGVPEMQLAAQPEQHIAMQGQRLQVHGPAEVLQHPGDGGLKRFLPGREVEEAVRRRAGLHRQDLLAGAFAIEAEPQTLGVMLGQGVRQPLAEQILIQGAADDQRAPHLEFGGLAPQQRVQKDGLLRKRKRERNQAFRLSHGTILAALRQLLTPCGALRCRGRAG